MNKKIFEQPIADFYNIKRVNIICTSGEEEEEIVSLGGNDGDVTPTTTTKNGYTGIFGD